MALPVDKNDASSLAAAVRHIRGNLPVEIKQTLETILHQVMSRSPAFGSSIGRRIVITEASIVPKAEEASRTEARVVCEVTVGEGRSESRTLSRQTRKNKKKATRKLSPLPFSSSHPCVRKIIYLTGLNCESHRAVKYRAR
jgi:hypothetical protein